MWGGERASDPLRARVCARTCVCVRRWWSAWWWWWCCARLSRCPRIQTSFSDVWGEREREGVRGGEGERVRVTVRGGGVGGVSGSKRRDGEFRESPSRIPAVNHNRPDQSARSSRQARPHPALPSSSRPRPPPWAVLSVHARGTPPPLTHTHAHTSPPPPPPPPPLGRVEEEEEEEEEEEGWGARWRGNGCRKQAGR